MDDNNVTGISLLGPVLTNMRLSKKVFAALSHQILSVIHFNKHNVINCTFCKPCVVIYVCNNFTEHNMANLINSNKINAVVVNKRVPSFDVSLTVHLSITLANDQLDAQIFNIFITILYMYMFRAISCSSSGGQIVLIQHLVSSLSVSDRPEHNTGW